MTVVTGLRFDSEKEAATRVQVARLVGDKATSRGTGDAWRSASDGTAMIAADVVIVLVLAYVATATSAAIVWFVLGLLCPLSYGDSAEATLGT